MSEPSAEFTEIPPEERKARFVEIADSIKLQHPEQFLDEGIDYSRPWKSFKGQLSERMRRGLHDVVVLIQIGDRERLLSIRELDPNKSELLLGKRLSGRFYGGTWAPVMGKVEERDFVDEMVSSFPRMSFREFLTLVSASREEDEEKRFKSTTPSAIVARPYLDKETGRIIHVVLKSFTEIPQFLDRVDQKPGKTGRDREHSEFKFFRLDTLPTEQMTDGTKKAVKNALVKLAEVQE